jgi:hypothetical protein
MRLEFSSRPFRNTSVRPQPEIHFDERTGLLIIATPWGPRDAARLVVERMLDYLQMANADNEATSPFERLASLSNGANNLRTAAILANESLFREHNRESYKAGVEVVACAFTENELVWMQVGAPQILLCRSKGHPVPLGGTTDLAFDMSDGQNLLPPLPGAMLGLDSSIHATLGSFRLQAGDTLLLVSHSMLPRSLYDLTASQLNLETIARNFTQSENEAGFWLGLLKAKD